MKVLQINISVAVEPGHGKEFTMMRDKQNGAIPLMGNAGKQAVSIDNGNYFLVEGAFSGLEEREGFLRNRLVPPGFRLWRGCAPVCQIGGGE